MQFSEIQKFLPSKLARAVAGYEWRQNQIGESSSQVFRLEAKNKANLYLKIVSRAAGLSLFQEKQKLDWLENRLPVPKILSYAEDEINQYLLLSEIPGLCAIDDSLKHNPLQIVQELVRGLKQIHQVPTENCPFRVRLADKIELARERMLRGLVDEEDFDDERRGRSAADVFEEMIAAKPAGEDLAFTHGDYCVPNVIFEGGSVSGFVDWAGGGVADRYQDLALLSRSVAGNFGREYEKAVFESYGIEPDRQKIYFYRLLDEFF